MKRILFAGMIAATLALSTVSPAKAFDCTNQASAAQATIDKATTALKNVTDKQAHGLIHTLIDDAKMLLAGAKHNHAKPAAGKYDHARSLAKAGKAKASAEAALVLAGKS